MCVGSARLSCRVPSQRGSRKLFGEGPTKGWRRDTEEESLPGRQSRGVGFPYSGNGKYSERWGDRICEEVDAGGVRRNKPGNDSNT